jgi:hypothetical protein
MNVDKFWELIGDARRRMSKEHPDGNMDGQVHDLSVALARLPPRDVVSFRDHFAAKMSEAFTWELWGACYVIAMGCSDDWFVYFRRWLISMGRETFEQALADPESLLGPASAPEVEDVFFQEFESVPDDVYMRLTGDPIPASACRAATDPTGEPWSEEGDELERKYPTLWKAFRSTKGG